MARRYGFPELLILGDDLRRPTGSATLEDVLKDQAIREQEFVEQIEKLAEQMDLLRRRNLAVMPYLEMGMTVAEAVAAYRADFEEEG